MNYDDSLKTIKGIGDKTYERLSEIGLFTVSDMLEYFPRDYMEYEKPTYIKDIKENYVFTIKGMLINPPFFKRGRKVNVITGKIEDETGFIECIWFNTDYLMKTLKRGVEYALRGKIKKRGSSLVLEQAMVLPYREYKKIEDTLVPLYPSKKGISINLLKKISKEVIDNTEIKDDYMNLYSKPYINYYKEIHYPSSKENIDKARRYFIFKDIVKFLVSFKINESNSIRKKNSIMDLDLSLMNMLIESLPYKLTIDQNKCIYEIIDKLKGEYTFDILLQGDVGCGKTITSFIPLILLGLNLYQGALIAPTEVLAIQHYKNLEKVLMDFYKFLENNGIENYRKINIDVIIGSTPLKEKNNIKERLEKGDIQIIIGTHALLTDNTRFNNLSLIVTDEQHKFGINQKDKLISKGKNPNSILLSATPIPRSLLLGLFENLTIMKIDSKPKGKLPIKTAVLGVDRRIDALSFLKGELEKSHQAYIICPLIEENENKSGENVIDYVRKLKGSSLKNYNIDIIHGKMNNDEKNKVMERFSKGEIDILVGTTVIEVGIDVKNATLIIIENAEMFGAASLHQLRGRVGRGQDQSYAIFINGKDSARERLESISKTTDGMEIAKIDLEKRGPGEIFGVKQSGEISLGVDNLLSDSNILEEGKEAVEKVFKEDEKLDGKYKFLRCDVREIKKV